MSKDVDQWGNEQPKQYPSKKKALATSKSENLALLHRPQGHKNFLR